ncbi:hypothetical protein TNCV_1135931 [Trichonephila clavipes]|nr:hypothetical protein TNCV_1135931 [Trichonephila clavipes]
MYAQIKRDRWNELGSSLDSRSFNSKLWKLGKDISKEQPRLEKCKTKQSKHFVICTKCSSAQASSGHILSCLGLTRQDLVQDPLLVLVFFRVNGLMDLI